MRRRVNHVLHDILQAIDRVEEVTRGKTLTDFEGRWLVQRAIEVIFEASRAIPDHVANTRPEIPWARVRGIGNILRHDYDSVSDPILWRVVRDELPRLKRAVEALQKLAGD